jgi:outer membrane protein
MKHLLLLLFLTLASVSAPSYAQSVKIGYVDGARIETGTKRAFDISERLRREFGAREQEVKAQEERIKALQSQISGITDPRERETKEREFQITAQRFEQTARGFVQDLERRKAEERRKYHVEVTAVVRKIAAEKNYDAVVQEAVYSSKSIDITEQVVNALGGPAPKSAGK